MPKKTNEKLDELATAVANRFAGADERFASVDRHLDELSRDVLGIDDRLDKVEGRLGSLKTNVDIMKNTATIIDSRLETTERVVARIMSGGWDRWKQGGTTTTFGISTRPLNWLGILSSLAVT